MRNTTASAERIGRYRRGRFSEWLAAAALLAKGYRILGRRVRTPYGEIDLIALRGRRLAFVEVKRRATRGEAEAAVTSRQAGRIARAAAFWVSRHPAFRDLSRVSTWCLCCRTGCRCICRTRSTRAARVSATRLGSAPCAGVQRDIGSNSAITTL